MMQTSASPLPVGSKAANWLAITAALLAPLVVLHPTLAVLALTLTAGCLWLAVRHQVPTALRVGLLLAGLLIYGLLAAPFPVWFAVAGLWALGRRFPQLRPETGWIPAGRPSARTRWFTVLIVVTAGVALTVWATTTAGFGESTTEAAEAIADVPVLLLIPGAILFVICNAFTEEIAYRLVVFDAAQSIVSPAVAVGIQGLAFGLLHINGFPAGTAGVALAFVYGFSLGVLRVMSGGMRAPIVAHLAADATIAVLFFVVVVPAAT